MHIQNSFIFDSSLNIIMHTDFFYVSCPMSMEVEQIKVILPSESIVEETEASN